MMKVFLGDQLLMKRSDEKCFRESISRTGGDGRAFSNLMVRRRADEKGLSDRLIRKIDAENVL